MEDEKIIQDYEKWLYKIAHQMLGGRSAKFDDLVQEGRVALWKALHSYDPSKGALPAWLTFKAHNHMRDYLRVAPTKKPLSEAYYELADGTEDDAALDYAASDALDQVEKADVRREIREAVSRLTPTQQKYVRMRFYEDVPYADITREYGYEPRGVWATVKKNLTRELAHLQGVC